MSPVRRVKTRTQPCTVEQARKWLADAHKFLEVAELASGESSATSVNVAAANAAPAGIAAADAACCRALGERSRGDDHRDALALVGPGQPGRHGRGERPRAPARAQERRRVRPVEHLPDQARVCAAPGTQARRVRRGGPAAMIPSRASDGGTGACFAIPAQPAHLAQERSESAASRTSASAPSEASCEAVALTASESQSYCCPCGKTVESQARNTSARAERSE
jgi:hypothetical protein